MRIRLLQVDKTQESYIAEGAAVYERRLKNYIQLEIQTINVPKNVRQRTIAEQKLEEGKLILQVVQADETLILLDEKGKEQSSQEFAAFISQKQNASTKSLVFLIGGPFGFDEKIYQRANGKLSLSKMTFSHQMIRLFFVEQIYRAYTIIRGEKYHHD